MMAAYNITSKYGDIAYDNTAGITSDPAHFEPVDPTKWEDVKKVFNGIMKNYENIIKIVTKLGSHGTFEEVVLTKEKTTNAFMIYLHQHMVKNTSMYETCVGCLPAGTSFESTSRGSLNSADHGNVYRGTGTGKKKKSWLAEKSTTPMVTLMLSLVKLLQLAK